MKRVYMAGAYSADNIVDCLKNIGRGQKYSADVFMMGHFPFCPWHDRSYTMENWDKELTVKQFQDFSMAWLEVSDCVFLVPGWENSKGTLAEIKRAKELGIPVYNGMNNFIIGLKLEPIIKNNTVLRVIRENFNGECPNCGSSVRWRWKFWLKNRGCINSKCKNFKEN
jgi:hypothetical protein